MYLLLPRDGLLVQAKLLDVDRFTSVDGRDAVETNLGNLDGAGA